MEVLRATALLRKPLRRMGFPPGLSGYWDPSSRCFIPLTLQLSLCFPLDTKDGVKQMAKVSAPGGPHTGWGAASQQAGQPSRPRELSPGEVCSRKAESTGFGVRHGQLSSPRVAVYMCPRASDTPHFTPLPRSCSEGPTR